MISKNRSKSGEHPKKRGVAFIIAILVSSVALAVGMGVYQRTYKELLLGSFWKHTQTSFSATNSGLECAKYRESFPVASSCFGSTFTWLPLNYVEGSPLTLDVEDGCVQIIVTKDASGTTITSRGSNGACGTTNLRRVESELTWFIPL